MRFAPSTKEPVQFDDTVNKATIVLPSETPGYRIVSDVNVLEVCTNLLKLSCNGHIDIKVNQFSGSHRNSHRCTWGMAVRIGTQHMLRTSPSIVFPSNGARMCIAGSLISLTAPQIRKEQVDIAQYFSSEEEIPSSYPQKIRFSIYPTGSSATPDQEHYMSELTVLGFEQPVSFNLIPPSASKQCNYVFNCNHIKTVSEECSLSGECSTLG